MKLIRKQDPSDRENLMFVGLGVTMQQMECAVEQISKFDPILWMERGGPMTREIMVPPKVPSITTTTTEVETKSKIEIPVVLFHIDYTDEQYYHWYVKTYKEQ